MAAPATHDDTIFDITLTLDPSPAGQRGFSRVLLIADDTLSNSGNRTEVYSGPTAVENDLDSGEINQAERDALITMFAQSPRPEEIQLGNRDTVAGESLKDAFDEIKAVDPGFYAVTAIDDTDTVQNAFINAIESEDHIFIFRASDTSLKDASPSVLSGNLSGYPGKERSALIFHDDPNSTLASGAGSGYADAAWAANRLAFNQDESSPPWFGPALASVEDYSTPITPADKTNMIGPNAADGGNAVNVILPAGGTGKTVFRGHNGNTRPIYIIVTRDWFAARLQERVTDRVLSKSQRGEKLEVSTEGQSELGGIIRNQFERGVEAGHFKAGQLDITYPTITDADLNAERLRVEAAITLSVAAQEVEFNIDLFRDDVVEDAA